MSWQGDLMAEQDAADALSYMGEAEWRDLYDDRKEQRELEKLKEMGNAEKETK